MRPSSSFFERKPRESTETHVPVTSAADFSDHRSRASTDLPSETVNSPLHDSTEGQACPDPNPSTLVDSVDVDPSLVPAVNFKMTPSRPTRKEIEQHEVTHLPYAPWCSTCIASKATDDAHRRQPPGHEQDSRQMAKVCFDYAFFRSRPGSPLIPVLVGVCKRTGLKMAGVVRDRYGRLPATIQMIEDGLRTMGHHGAVTLRSDGESALQDLLRNVAMRRRAITLVEHGPRGDGQANGLVERAIRSVEEHTRAIKRDLEQRLDADIDPQHNLFSWIVRHATDLLNKFSVGVDGRTAWQRLRGVPYRGEVMKLGTCVMHRLSGRIPGGLLVDRWNEGHWMGKNSHSDEHLILTSSGTIVRARSVKSLDRKPATTDLLKVPTYITGSPATICTDNLDDEVGTRSRHPRTVPEEPESATLGTTVFDNTLEPEPRPETAPNEQSDTKAHQWRITVLMLREFGFSENCQGCRSVQLGHKSHHTHSVECRRRLEVAMSDRPKMQSRFSDSEFRVRMRKLSEQSSYNQGRACSSSGVDVSSRAADAQTSEHDNKKRKSHAGPTGGIQNTENIEKDKFENIDFSTESFDNSTSGLPGPSLNGEGYNAHRAGQDDPPEVEVEVDRDRKRRRDSDEEANKEENCTNRVG